MALPRAKLGVSLFRHPCRKPLSPGKGLYYWGYRPKSKQGCLQSATQSHCTMQWYKWLTTCMGGYAPQPHFLITKKFFYRLLIYVFYRNIIYQCGGMELLLLRSGILFLAVLFCQCVKQILYIFAYLTICIKISAVCKLQAARIHRFIAYKNHTV